MRQGYRRPGRPVWVVALWTAAVAIVAVAIIVGAVAMLA
jgi:hypothetical protein